MDSVVQIVGLMLVVALVAGAWWLFTAGPVGVKRRRRKARDRRRQSFFEQYEKRTGADDSDAP